MLDTPLVTTRAPVSGMANAAARIVLLSVLAVVSARADPQPARCIRSTVELGEHGHTAYWQIALPPGIRAITVAPGRPTGYPAAALWKPVRKSAAQLKGNVIDVGASTDRHLSLEMDVSKNLERPDRTYPPYFRFADGTVALLSDDFRLQAEGFRNSCVTFVAPKGARVFGNHGVSSRSVHLDSRWSGYVALGDPRYYAADHESFIQDRGVPAWIGTSIRGTVRHISDFYSSRLGERGLPEIFIFSAPPGHMGADPSGFHGDVLPNSITLNFFGTDWAKKQRLAVAQALGMLSHELFHLWNSNPDSQSPGNLLAMEGGAQFARALSESRFESHQTTPLSALSDALSSCLNELGAGRSLGSLLQESPGSLPYDCGPPFVLAAVTAGRRAMTVQDAFFAGWKSALDRAGREGYDWKELIARTASPTTVAVLSRAISVPGGYERNLRKALLASGYDLLPDPHLSQQGRVNAASRLMGEIMSSDCHGQVSFYTKFPSGFLIAPLPGTGACASLAPNETVVRIEGESPWLSPLALSARVAGICAKRGYVRVSLAGRAATQKVSCSDTVHELPEPVTLRADPGRGM